MFEKPSLEDIQKEMLHLNPKKAGKFEDIPPKILKNDINVFCEALKIFFNDTVIHGEFPNELEKVDVTPIFRKDDLTKVKSYRPVSVLPVVSKVFERKCISKLVNILNSLYYHTCVAIGKVLVYNKNLYL